MEFLLLSLIIAVCLGVFSLTINNEKVSEYDVSIFKNSVFFRETFTEKEAYNKTLKPDNYEDLKKWENIYNGFLKFENRLDDKIKPFYFIDTSKTYFYLKYKNLYSEVCISYDKKNGTTSYFRPCNKEDLKCKPIRL